MSFLNRWIALTPRLTHFKLVSSRMRIDSLFDGSYWEQMIMENLPLLEKFEFFIEYQYRHDCRDMLKKLPLIINRFQVPFWMNDHRWFVTCDYVLKRSQIRLYTIPAYIADFDKLSITAEFSSIDNAYRLVIPTIRKNSSDNDIKVCLKL